LPSRPHRRTPRCRIWWWATLGSLNVTRYDGNGALEGTFLPSGVGGLADPRGLAFSGNFLYVASGNNSEILRFDATTGAPAPAPGQLGGLFASGNGLNGPEGLTFDQAGNLYVSSARGGSNSVLEFNGTTGQFIRTFVTSGSGGLAHSDGSDLRPRSQPVCLQLGVGSGAQI